MTREATKLGRGTQLLVAKAATGNLELTTVARAGMPLIPALGMQRTANQSILRIISQK